MATVSSNSANEDDGKKRKSIQDYMNMKGSSSLRTYEIGLTSTTFGGSPYTKTVTPDISTTEPPQWVWPDYASGRITWNDRPLVSPCRLQGHVVDLTSYAEYLDGEIHATCGTCGERLVFSGVPGGVPKMRLSALMELLLNETIENRELFEGYVEVKEQIAKERLALEEAEALLRTMELVLGAIE